MPNAKDDTWGVMGINVPSVLIIAMELKFLTTALFLYSVGGISSSAGSPNYVSGDTALISFVYHKSEEGAEELLQNAGFSSCPYPPEASGAELKRNVF